MVLPSSSCVTVHSPGFSFCFFTFSTPYLSLNVTAIPAPYAQNVTAIPAPYAQSVLTQCAKGSCGGLEKISPFLWTTFGFLYGTGHHLRSYSHPPSLGPESSGPLQFVLETCWEDHMQHKQKDDTMCRLYIWRTQWEVLEVTFRGSDHLASFHFRRNFFSLTHSVGWGIGSDSVSGVTCWENCLIRAVSLSK